MLAYKQTSKENLRAVHRVYRIETMTMGDVPEVSRVEARCFSNPWPPAAYRRELRLPEQNHYIVLRSVQPPAEPASESQNGQRIRSRLLPLPFPRRNTSENRIVGFAGMWTVYDEAHITTIGVDPDVRGHGLGEWLLVHLIDEAVKRRAAWLTLEVRVSNEPAQALYRKYGFTVHGTRKRYYSDNDEDAHIMWSPSLRDPEYLARFRELRGSITAQFSVGHVEQMPVAMPVSDSGA